MFLIFAKKLINKKLTLTASSSVMVSSIVTLGKSGQTYSISKNPKLLI